MYLYKQGTFYPFAPTGPAARDNLLEIEVRNHLAGELPMEADLGRLAGAVGRARAVSGPGGVSRRAPAPMVRRAERSPAR